MSQKKTNQWLNVSDLIEILKDMPQDAKVVVNNSRTWVDGVYYATRSDIELYDADGYDEPQVMIGTNYMTTALGFDDM